MTKPAHQDTPPGVSVFSRTRRAAAAAAFSLGLGSLVYGTVLSLPASAATDPPPGTGVTCTASPSPTGTDTGTATGTATTGAAIPADAGATTATSTETGSPTATATGTGGDCPTTTTTTSTATTATATATATGTSKTTGTASASASATTGASRSPSKPPTTPVPVKSVTQTPAKGGPTARPPVTATSSVPVYVVAPTGTSSYFAYADVPPGDASQQLPHGTISRAEIMARAALWVREQVPYSQTTWHTDRNGTYRQDCSGYVSMAWDLDQYTDFWTGNLNLVSHTIPAAQLLPGDILLSDEHTILFAGWANPEHTSFDYYEEAHPGTVARFVEDAPLAAFLDNGFAPFRYDGVVNSSSLPANPNGDLYSQLTQQGSEIHPSGVVPGFLRGLSSPSATSTAKLAAQAAADISASNARSGGVALGVGGAFLVGAGLLMRRPVLQARRRRH